MTEDGPLDDTAFWEGLRRDVLPLRPSQYDMTSRCNLTCEGCLFFSGADYLGHTDEDSHADIDAFFSGEAARGIRYGYFGGAEPSLVEDKLLIAARHIPYGTIFTNGTRRISPEIPYRIHVSVWGRPEREKVLRGAGMLKKQVRNYRGDGRAVFVFTITARNIDDIRWIVEFCADEGLPLTFNHYSPTSKYLAFSLERAEGDRYHARGRGEDSLVLEPHHLLRAREIIDDLLNQKRGRILYDHAFSAVMHDPAGLYPARDERGTARDCGVLLSPSLRHYNTDLTRSAEKCCTPNVDCGSCRLYAQSFATLLTRATRGLRQPQGMQRLIAVWRLWCAVFLNEPRYGAWGLDVAPRT